MIRAENLLPWLLCCLIAGSTLGCSTPDRSTPDEDPLRIAVASNFAAPMRELIDRFEQRTGREVSLSLGSTGKLYAQIRHGAPYDLFFAADRRRPELLEQEGRALAGSRFTYAVGRLVLWSPRADLVDARGEVLGSREFRFLAIANPELAPYGRAARQTLEALKLWPEVSGRVVRGENIGQTYQFVHSGNAELGFVADSQVRDTSSGSLWRVPQELYEPIEQQVVLLQDQGIAREFLAFVRGEDALEIIRGYGYANPDAS